MVLSQRWCSELRAATAGCGVVVPAPLLLGYIALRCDCRRRHCGVFALWKNALCAVVGQWKIFLSEYSIIHLWASHLYVCKLIRALCIYALLLSAQRVSMISHNVYVVALQTSVTKGLRVLERLLYMFL